MNARKKLNAAYLGGSLAAASAIGWLTGSWGIFAILLAVLIALNLLGGDIRPDRKP